MGAKQSIFQLISDSLAYFQAVTIVEFCSSTERRALLIPDTLEVLPTFHPQTHALGSKPSPSGIRSTGLDPDNPEMPRLPSGLVDLGTERRTARLLGRGLARIRAIQGGRSCPGTGRWGISLRQPNSLLLYLTSSSGDKMLSTYVSSAVQLRVGVAPTRPGSVGVWAETTVFARYTSRREFYPFDRKH